MALYPGPMTSQTDPTDVVYEVRTWEPTSTKGYFCDQWVDRESAIYHARQLTGKRLHNRRAEVVAVGEGLERTIYVIDITQGIDQFVIYAARSRLRRSSLAEGVPARPVLSVDTDGARLPPRPGEAAFGAGLEH